VVVAITPWNFPLTLMANKVCPALAAGCNVVLKPASTTPLATQKTIEIINSVGIPAGVLNTVHGPGAEIGDALVSHPKVNKIAFTGQSEPAKRIMKLASANVLAGGKRPEGKEFERGWFMEATVLSDVPEDSRMATEEVFGPALPIFIVKDLDDAIAKANATIYGLGSSIWTMDLAKARRAA